MIFAFLHKLLQRKYLCDENESMDEIGNSSPQPVNSSDKHVWKESMETILKSWRREASVNLWLQLASYYYYSSIADFLTYPSIVLSAGTSIGVFGLQDTLAGKYVASVLVLSAGVLTSLLKHSRASEKSQTFMLCSKDYYMLIRDIDYILTTEPADRASPTDVLQKVKITYDRIVDMQLDPPLHIIRKYNSKFKRSLEETLIQSNLDTAQALFDRTSDHRQRHSPMSRIDYCNIHTPEITVELSQPPISTRVTNMFFKGGSFRGSEPVSPSVATQV